MSIDLFPNKICLFAFFGLCLFSFNSFGQNLPPNTIWEGKLIGMRFILKVNEDSVSKKVKAVFDSPDQGALGLPVSELTIISDSLNAYSSAVNGGFKGKFNTDRSELSGKWSQMGKEFDLTFKRVEKTETVKRTQTPKAPFPYTEERIIYFNSDKSIQYGATLTVPPSIKGVPVVILITGSGQQDREETLFGHKPF